MFFKTQDDMTTTATTMLAYYFEVYNKGNIIS